MSVPAGLQPSRAELPRRLVETLGLMLAEDVSTRLSAVAGQLGVRIEFCDGLDGLQGQAVMDSGGGGARIYVDRSLALCDRRMTVAHELAHVLLAQVDVHRWLSRPLDVGGGREEERLCDEVAASLLVPESALIGQVEGLSLRQLMETAAVWQVPLGAVVDRLVQLRFRPLPLLTLRKVRSRWTPTALVGTVGLAPLPTALQLQVPLDVLEVGAFAWSRVGLSVLGGSVRGVGEIHRLPNSLAYLLWPVQPQEARVQSAASAALAR